MYKIVLRLVFKLAMALEAERLGALAEFTRRLKSENQEQYLALKEALEQEKEEI